MYAVRANNELRDADLIFDLLQRPLEIAEGLEQLRPLEHGLAVQVVEVDYGGRTHYAVDKPEDIKRVEEILAREGELTCPGAS